MALNQLFQILPLIKAAQGVQQPPVRTPDYSRAIPYEQQGESAMSKLLGMKSPEPVTPAFRTEDAIKTLIGLALTGGKNPAEFVTGYVQGKQGLANQHNQRNMQEFDLLRQGLEGQANQAFRMGENERKRAQDTFEMQVRGDERQATLDERRRAAMESAATKRETADRASLDRQFSTLLQSARANVPAVREQSGKALAAFLQKNPQYIGDATSFGFDPSQFGALTPSEGLASAKTETEDALRADRLAKVKAEVQAINKGMEAKDAQIAKWVEETRLLPERYAIERARNEAYLANAASLMADRNLDNALKVSETDTVTREKLSVLEDRIRETQATVNALKSNPVPGMEEVARAYESELTKMRAQQVKYIQTLQQVNKLRKAVESAPTMTGVIGRLPAIEGQELRPFSPLLLPDMPTDRPAPSAKPASPKPASKPVTPKVKRNADGSYTVNGRTYKVK